MIPYYARLDNLAGRVITRTTLQKMHDLVRLAKQDWAWIRNATLHVQKVPSKNYLGEARRLFGVWHYNIWGLNAFRYIRDPNQVETVESVWHLLDRKASDCDGWAVWYCALAGAIGFPYQFKTINADLTRPDSPSHVYAQVSIPGHGWVSADLTVKEARFGWEPGGYPFQIWPEPQYD
jgi:transglutaminase-like putative cysteine protease